MATEDQEDLVAPVSKVLRFAFAVKLFSITLSIKLINCKLEQCKWSDMSNVILFTTFCIGEKGETGYRGLSGPPGYTGDPGYSGGKGQRGPPGKDESQLF